MSILVMNNRPNQKTQPCYGLKLLFCQSANCKSLKTLGKKQSKYNKEGKNRQKLALPIVKTLPRPTILKPIEPKKRNNITALKRILSKSSIIVVTKKSILQKIVPRQKTNCCFGNIYIANYQLKGPKHLVITCFLHSLSSSILELA